MLSEDLSIIRTHWHTNAYDLGENKPELGHVLQVKNRVYCEICV